MNLSKQIQVHREKFIKHFQDKPEDIRRFYHYGSVLNLSSEIIKYSNPELDPLKKKIITFFNKVEESGYSISDRYEIGKLYHNNLLAVGNYFIKNQKFRTKMDLYKNLIFGILLDVGIYFLVPNYYYPVFSLLFYVRGFHKHKKSIKNNKFFSYHW